jgi:nitrate reductase alpha subunit
MCPYYLGPFLDWLFPLATNLVVVCGAVAVAGEFEHYLGILKAVHSGTDLHTCAAAADWCTPNEAKGHLDYVLWNLHGQVRLKSLKPNFPKSFFSVSFTRPTHPLYCRTKRLVQMTWFCFQ